MSTSLVVAFVALVPLVALTMTSFVKVSVVLSLVRNAIGAPDAPSALVVTGLSLVLTFFVMAPVAAEVVRAAGSPAAAEVADAPNEAAIRAVLPPAYQGDADVALRAAQPLRVFLLKHARAADVETFTALARKLGHDVRGDELWIAAPAFVTSELRAAFVIAIAIFLPFLVIDLIVGLSLASLGLASMSPQTVALPLKLLLFVAIDGWRLLIESLLGSYA